MKTSDYIALVATFTAVAALIATIWQLYLTRLHNIKSMRPVLDLTAHLNRGTMTQYTLANHGVGPAFVTKVSYFVGEKEYSECTPKDIRNLLYKLGYSRGNLYFHCMTQLENCPIGVGKEVKLIQFPGTELDDEYSRYMSTLLENFTIQVEYKSVYEETYTVRLAKVL